MARFLLSGSGRFRLRDWFECFQRNPESERKQRDISARFQVFFSCFLMGSRRQVYIHFSDTAFVLSFWIRIV